MKDIHKRILLFCVLCFPSRCLIAYLARTLTGQYLKLLAIIATIISIGFMYIFITGTRKVGIETIGAPIWWNSLRPIHSMLYFLFAVMVFVEKENPEVPLVIDAMIGLFSFLTYHIFVRNS